MSVEAQEVVRRAERCIGLAIRRGQAMTDNVPDEDGQRRDGGAGKPAATQGAAARLVGVSRDSVQLARVVRERGVPELEVARVLPRAEISAGKRSPKFARVSRRKVTSASATGAPAGGLR